MRRCKAIPLAALFTVAIVLSAAAEPASGGQPWPEAHSGAYLGVQIAPVTPQQASALKLPDAVGAIITYVDQDGPACRAGLMENDVVVAFEGSKIDDPQQLQGLIHGTPPQKTVTLTVLRGGQRKDIKVTLGSWNVMSHARANPPLPMGAPPPPRAYVPDLEIPSFTVLSARHGLVVESLSPQLADFFGVTRGQGVLVRSVENGSPAAAAGIKAGDVILKVNNETIRDMADWQRGMRSPGPKVWVSVWRDKHEQTYIITLPNRDNSRLLPGDKLDFDTGIQIAREQAEQLRPEIELRQQELMAQLEPSQKEWEQMRHEVEESMKLQQQEIEKASRELAASAKCNQEEMERLRQQIERSVPSQNDLDEMKRQLQQSMPSQKDWDQMKRQMQSSLPSQKEIDETRQQIESSMKSWTPQMQQDMEQLKKQMEQQKQDLQQMMRDFNSDRVF